MDMFGNDTENMQSGCWPLVVLGSPGLGEVALWPELLPAQHITPAVTKMYENDSVYIEEQAKIKEKG